MSTLEVFFNPRSVAVVGASDKPGSLGRGLALNVISTFKGPVYLVNVKGGVVLGRSVYRRVADIPGGVDLALIITPAASVPEVLEDCGLAGARGAIVYSGGFSESGRRDLEEEVVRVARKHNIRLLGPNCVGVVDTRTPLNATFVSTDRQLIPPPGGISIVSQSGALGSLILDLMGERLVGLRRFASVGNASDVKMWELLEYLASDPGTRAVGLYFESVGEGRRLLDTLRRISKTKPVVALVGGLSESGSRAASTHVAALTTNARILEGALRQAGVIRARSLTEFIAALEVLEKAKIKPSGGKVAIVTNTGGMGVLLSDSLERRGLRLPGLPESLSSKLRSVVPSYMPLGNPLDLSGAAKTELFRRVVEEIAGSRAFDVLVIVNQPQTIAMDVEEFLEYSRSLAGMDIPVVMLISGSSYSREVAGRIRSMGIPVAFDPEEASMMILTLVEAWRTRVEGLLEVNVKGGGRVEARKIIEGALAEGRVTLTEFEAKKILEAYDLSTPRNLVVSSCDEAIEASDKLGYPVVVKVISRGLLHKSDVGGIALNLGSPVEVGRECSRIVGNVTMKGYNVEAILVEEYVEPIAEIALGALRDELLGPIVMVGLGGYLVELLEQVSFRLAPLTLEDAIEMIGETRLEKLATGYRGVKLNTLELAEAIVKLGKLVYENPEIRELDVNPLILARDGKLVAVDAKVRLGASSSGELENR